MHQPSGNAEVLARRAHELRHIDDGEGCAPFRFAVSGSSAIVIMHERRGRRWRREPRRALRLGLRICICALAAVPPSPHGWWAARAGAVWVLLANGEASVHPRRCAAGIGEIAERQRERPRGGALRPEREAIATRHIGGANLNNSVIAPPVAWMSSPSVHVDVLVWSRASATPPGPIGYVPATTLPFSFTTPNCTASRFA